METYDEYPRFFRSKPRDKFAMYYKARLVSRGEQGPIEYDASEFLLRIGEGSADLVVRHLFRRYEMYPERWFVDAFPTPEELRRMDAREM